MTRRSHRHHPRPRESLQKGTPLGVPVVPIALFLLLIAAVGADVSRIGFFADDFHLLDVARRVPFAPLLSGEYGIWPWYRPLAREGYFEVLVAAGPAALAVAHTLSLTCLFGCTWLLVRLGRRLVGGMPAAVAPALFLSYSFTKFLTAWSSGFQDLLALLLTLSALEAHLARPHPLARGGRPRTVCKRVGFCCVSAARRMCLSVRG